MFKKEIAKREKVKLMIGLTGPSGSGKTFSSLLMAYGITKDWKKIALADTENKSALYYAGERTGEWQHIDFNGSDLPDGYSPNNWIKLIEFVEDDPEIDVLILDSISHEWEGVGGTLEIADEGRFGGWRQATPMHRAFIDKMRQSRLHIIATMRSKTDYIVETNEKGKAAPRKVGTKSTQREGTDYEFGIIFDIEIKHYASATKDRTGLFAKRGSFKISSDTGDELKKWAEAGLEKAEGKTESTPEPEQSAPAPAGTIEDSPKFDIRNREWSDWFIKVLKKRKITDSTVIASLAEKLEGKSGVEVKESFQKILAEVINDRQSQTKLDQASSGGDFEQVDA